MAAHRFFGWLGLFASCCALGLAARSRADEPNDVTLPTQDAPADEVANAGPMRVVVRAPDARMLARLRGQTSDLAVELVVDDTFPLDAAIEAQLAEARERCAAANASAVVWIERLDAGGLMVAVGEPAAGRLFLRQIEAGRTSANYESAAVVIRTALRALTAGGEIGVQEPRIATPSAAPSPSPEVIPSPPPVTTTQLARPATPPRARPHGTIRVRADVGWWMLGDGLRVHDGPAARLSLELGPWVLGVSALVGLAGPVHQPLFAADVARHELSATLGVRPFRAFMRVHVPMLELVLGLRLGVVLYRRSTTSTASDVQAAPPATLASPAISPEVIVRFRPLMSHLDISIVGSADLVPASPRFTIDRNDGLIASQIAPSWFQPRVVVFVGVHD